MKIFIKLFIILPLISYSDPIPEKWEFIAPHAAQIEGRVGTFYQNQNDRLRLDIGNSFVLMHGDLGPNKFTLGGDFMTYTRIRSEGRLKFPVETTDYYFGVNSAYNFNLLGLNWDSRIRIAHISSHIIDGYSDDNGLLSVIPFTYSREFVDIVLMANTKIGLRPYIGLNTIFSTIPDNVNTFEPQIGFDYSYQIIDILSINAGYDLRLLGQNDLYRGSNSFQAGIKYHTENNKGIYLGYYYFAGHSIHGMFIGQYDEYSGIGFQIYY